MHVMGVLRFFLLFLFLSSVSCHNKDRTIPTIADSISVHTDTLHAIIPAKGALLLTRFKSFDELKRVVQISYFGDRPGVDSSKHVKGGVRLTHRSCNREVISILETGISEGDFHKAKDGVFWDRAWLGVMCPFAAIYRKDLLRIEILARRRQNMFGEGDVAFYDLAETMVFHIRDADILSMPTEDLSEKGYLNTFNHIIAQAFITSRFSEDMADFIADIHERYHTPELISGTFTEEQLSDIEEGPVDNYLDMINNEWGQELGKELKNKYKINRKTQWTPALLADYLNDIQSYHSWAFQIGFEPFRTTDDIVIRFAEKINNVGNDIDKLRSYYY